MSVHWCCHCGTKLKARVSWCGVMDYDSSHQLHYINHQLIFAAQHVSMSFWFLLAWRVTDDQSAPWHESYASGCFSIAWCTFNFITAQFAVRHHAHTECYKMVLNPFFAYKTKKMYFYYLLWAGKFTVYHKVYALTWWISVSQHYINQMICNTKCIIEPTGPKSSNEMLKKIHDLIELCALYYVQYLFGIVIICNILLIELGNTGNCNIVEFAQNCEFSLWCYCFNWTLQAFVFIKNCSHCTLLLVFWIFLSKKQKNNLCLVMFWSFCGNQWNVFKCNF